MAVFGRHKYLHSYIIYQINPPFWTYRNIPNTVVNIPLVFDAQSITADRPLLRKKKTLKFDADVCRPEQVIFGHIMRDTTGRDLSN